ncbi:MAG: hypothetical protein JW818_08470 [Pirellulales bacterium]|nr:hypothetical protein [Pirellulales bacterium]
MPKKACSRERDVSRNSNLENTVFKTSPDAMSTRAWIDKERPWSGHLDPNRTFFAFFTTKARKDENAKVTKSVGLQHRARLRSFAPFSLLFVFSVRQESLVGLVS